MDSGHHFGAHIFRLEAELLRHDVDGLRIQTLVDGHHQSEVHTSTDDLRDRHVHHRRQLADGHELRDLQFALFQLLLLLFLLHPEGLEFTFLTTVLGALRLLAFAGQASQRLLDLLLYLLLVYFRTDDTTTLLEVLLVGLITVISVFAVVVSAVILIVSVLTVTAFEVRDIHTFLLDTFTFLFVVLISSEAIAISVFSGVTPIEVAFVITLFTFLLTLLLGLLLWACPLVQGVQIDLTHHIDGRLLVWSGKRINRRIIFDIMSIGLSRGFLRRVIRCWCLNNVLQ